MILNETALVEALQQLGDVGFFYIGTIAPSPDDRHLAFTYDLQGGENYTGRIVPLKVWCF